MEMTVEEAISFIETISQIQDENFISEIMGTWYKEISDDYHNALDMAIDALKKQIPSKPVKADKPRYGMGYEYHDWHCPTCDRLLAFETQRDKLPQICKCGQKINWSEEEDDR